jgi:hypothetical protein
MLNNTVIHSTGELIGSGVPHWMVTDYEYRTGMSDYLKIQDSNFSTFLPNLIIIYLFNYNYSHGSEVMYHCGFYVHFLNE